MAVTVSINSVQLTVDGAWELKSPHPLLNQGRARGTNWTAAGVDGVTHRDKSRSDVTVTLDLFVYGENNVSGTPFADEQVGLRDNIEYLYTNVVDATKTQGRTCTVTYGDASTRSGSVECPEMRIEPYNGEKATVIVARLYVTLLSGKLS